MQEERVAEIARKLNEAGIPPDFGPDHSQLLIQVWRLLAKGSPVTGEQVDRIITDLGIPAEDGHQFLREVSERDAEDQIVGIIGLSLNDEWQHRFQVNGTSLRTWCAWDALFLPPCLTKPSPSSQPLRGLKRPSGCGSALGSPRCCREGCDGSAGLSR